MKALRQMIERVRENPDRAWALATLVETCGSTYRKPGARMLVDEDGGTIGVLSGGCLEEEIAQRAMGIIGGTGPVLMTFDTRRLYGCNGEVRILVERLAPSGSGGNFLTELGAALQRRELCRSVTSYEGGEIGTTLLGPTEIVSQRPGTFLHNVPLPIRLLLFGAGPEIVPVRQFAETLGWIVHHFSHPSELPEGLVADEQSAALVMTHQFGRDLAVLDRLLPLQLPYVGLLGPRNRYRQIVTELFERCALKPEILLPIHAPAGLDIGSESPEEIALSIVAEVSAVLAQRHGGHLREKATAIHIASGPEAERVA